MVCAMRLTHTNKREASVEQELILSVRDLHTHFILDEGILKAVDGVDFDIPRRRTLGMIGESGSGKSVTAYSIMRTVMPPGKIVQGTIDFHMADGKIVDLTTLDPFGRAMRAIRGRDIAMIFQEPSASLSPVHTIGAQIMEMVLLHRTSNRREAKAIVLDMLDKVGLPNPAQRFGEYPHQLSGGMCQRAMIAQALSCHPALLIADEPTTALDVTVQAQILDLIRSLQDEMGMSVLYITHDLGVIAEIADMVAVMYLGRIVEYADVRTIFRNPLHPYTKRLLKAIPTFRRHATEYLENIKGNVPVPLNPPKECGFYSRCLIAEQGLCNASVPPLEEVEPGHLVRCFLVGHEPGAASAHADKPRVESSRGIY
jgi:oligopeptide/dipeptide ABC transporter ATP-binding protein